MTELDYPDYPDYAAPGETAESEVDLTRGTGEPRDASEDEFPTRQDARAATWGDHPEYDDDDPGAEYDGELGALAGDEDRLPTRPDARAATWGDNPEYDEDDPGAEYDADVQAPDGSSTIAAEQEEHSPADANARITELEAENAHLGKSITQLQARLERLESTNQSERTPFVSSRESGTAQQDAVEKENPQTQRRHLPTNEALALGAAATGGVITAVADYAPFLHADVAGTAASAVAVGAATVTWIRARGEARHANRSPD